MNWINAGSNKPKRKTSWTATPLQARFYAAEEAAYERGFVAGRSSGICDCAIVSVVVLVFVILFMKVLLG
jgi:hypothetical protein